MTNPEEQTIRMKSACVLYTLETELGKLAGRDRDETKDLVEDSYLSEVFDLAIQEMRDTTKSNYLSLLKNLCMSLDIFEIRNAICHPNRSFPECYWYRLAAIATDELIVKLEFSPLIASFRAAVDGRLEIPPEDWFKATGWKLPHNLPGGLSHAITGLVGREREMKKLDELLKNPRGASIAVTGPGGVGKTALVLEQLTDLANTRSTEERLDAIWYISLKTEQLTVDGVRKLDVDASLEELKDSMALEIPDILGGDFCDSFEDFCDRYKESRLLLFVDNLESILRDNPAEFEEFVLHLPAAWRVIVTSRVQVSNAWTLPLDGLSQAAATHLARIYSQRSGINDLTTEQLELIASKCRNNPLSVRLTIDLVVLGKPLPESMAQVASNVSEFSYNNLIEVLSEQSIGILECLFAMDKASRADFASALGVTPELVANALQELTRTSLVSRHSESDVEFYVLNSSVRDALRTNPINLAARPKIQKTLANQKDQVDSIRRSQDKRGLTRFDDRYIPEKIPGGLSDLIVRCIKYAFRRFPNQEKLTELLREFSANEGHFSSFSIFHRFYAVLYRALGDIAGATQEFQKALSITPDDFVSRFSFARACHDWHEYDDAEREYSRLIEMGCDDVEQVPVDFARKVVVGYFYSLMYNGKHKDILSKTVEWKEKGELRDIYGSFRSGAIKRAAEQYNEHALDLAVGELVRACRIADDVVRVSGYGKSTTAVTRNLIDDIKHRLTSPLADEKLDESQILELLGFADRHLHAVTSSDTETTTVKRSMLVSVLRSIEVSGNPFLGSKWDYFNTMPLEMELENLELEEDQIAVRVKNIPTGGMTFPRFIFATDSNGQDYYLHLSKLKNGDYEAWCCLTVGSILIVSIEGDEIGSEGKLPMPDSIWLPTCDWKTTPQEAEQLH